MDRMKGGDLSRRPRPEECDAYYGTYADSVPDGDIVETLVEQGRRLAVRLRAVPADRERFRYAEVRWSVREVVGHILDVERVFAHRALHVARGNRDPLPDMDQNAWARHAGAHDRPLEDMVADWEVVRAATVALFRGMPPDAWDRRGSVVDREVTVRALAWTAAGHVIQHERTLGSLYGV